MADRLRKIGVVIEVLLAAVGRPFVLAELAVVLRLPMPSVLPWTIISVVGAATVLSFAALAEYFLKEIAARAIAALNLLHFGYAFVMQWNTGVIVTHFAPVDGHYPLIGYQTASAIGLLFQEAALASAVSQPKTNLRTLVVTSSCDPMKTQEE